MTRNGLINQLLITKEVDARYMDENGDIHVESLDVSYHPVYEHGGEYMGEHFLFEWEDGGATLWVDEMDELEYSGDDWVSFHDPNYGTVEFKIPT